jgi:hypothetical protein
VIIRRFSRKKYRRNKPCVSSQIQLYNVVRATPWLKLRACLPVLWRAGARKGADAETVTGGLDLTRRAENRENFYDFDLTPNSLIR